MALSMPLFLVSTMDETVDCKWNWPECWMAKVYDISWLVLLALIPVIAMTGL